MARRSIQAAAERLHGAARSLVRALDGSEADSAARLAVLRALAGEGPQCLSALAEREGVRPPTMTVLIRAMEAEGLVARRPDPRDRRAVRIRVTKKGRARLARATKARVDALAKAIEDLEPSELGALEAAAERIERALE